MNPAHIHLLLNHFPIATLLFGFGILVTGRLQRNESVTRVALGLLVLGGAVGLASYLTGDPAADALKPFPTATESIVHEHRLAAGFGLAATIITALVAAGGLYLSRKKGVLSKSYLIFVIVINLWALSVLARVGYLGGQIAHPETRSVIKPG